MPSPASFFDSNVLLYLIGSDPEKAARAEHLIGEGGHISVQVLNEIANVARKKLKWSWPQIQEMSDTVRELLTVNPVTQQDHALAISVAESTGYSFYDSLIVASALSADCTILFTEDLQSGQIIAGRLTIRNPFKA
jgi:predicted nucleic acid-binding protein